MCWIFYGGSGQAPQFKSIASAYFSSRRQKLPATNIFQSYSKASLSLDNSEHGRTQRLQCFYTLFAGVLPIVWYPSRYQESR